jgi:hypothetical protein
LLGCEIIFVSSALKDLSLELIGDGISIWELHGILLGLVIVLTLGQWMSDYGHYFLRNLIKNLGVMPPVVILLFIGVVTVVHIPRIVIQEIEYRNGDIGEIWDPSQMNLSSSPYFEGWHRAGLWIQFDLFWWIKSD